MKKNIRQLAIRKLPSRETESKAKDELAVLVTILNYQYLALCTVYEQSYIHVYMITVN